MKDNGSGLLIPKVVKAEVFVGLSTSDTVAK
jgi:hypothetical protein